MCRPPNIFRLTLLLLAVAIPCRADDAGSTDKLPHIHVDAKAHRIAIECQALNAKIPLEFFCVTDGGNEHESVLRTPAKPSDIHFALLMLGLTPGAPATFVPSRQFWLPPHGPPLHIECTYVLNGKTITVPAYRMMRSWKTKQEMVPSIWVFDGSRVMPDGVYAADVTGYVVSICNFDLTLIDVPNLVSNANETLEWEYNPDLVPPKGTPVMMVIQAAPATEAATQPAGLPASQFNPGPGLNGVVPPATQPGASADPPDDQQQIDQCRQPRNDEVATRRDRLHRAAQAPCEVIVELPNQQQRLIEQARKMRRIIDNLEPQYQDMTSPLPATEQAGS